MKTSITYNFNHLSSEMKESLIDYICFIVHCSIRPDLFNGGFRKLMSASCRAACSVRFGSVREGGMG